MSRRIAPTRIAPLVGLIAALSAVALVRETTAAEEAPAPAPARSTSSAPVRRLEDFRIEGEIPAPQVLFVTARDPHRFAEFQHRRYLKTSLALGQETILPARIALVGSGPAGARKETAP